MMADVDRFKKLVELFSKMQFIDEQIDYFISKRDKILKEYKILKTEGDE